MPVMLPGQRCADPGRLRGLNSRNPTRRAFRTQSACNKRASSLGRHSVSSLSIIPSAWYVSAVRTSDIPLAKAAYLPNLRMKTALPTHTMRNTGTVAMS